MGRKRRDGGVMPGTQETVVALDRRVGTAPYSLSQIPFSEELCPEAFQAADDMCCVPRQIAAVMNLDFGLICNEMSEIERALYNEDTWQTRGCTPRMVIRFAKQRSLGACSTHNGAGLETLPGKTPLVAAFHESHLYFYKTSSTRKKLVAWKTPAAKGCKLRREHAVRATTPPAED